MNTLLMAGALPDQSSLVEDAGAVHFLLYPLMLLYMLLASLTVMNMLVGILCEVVSVVSAVEKEEILLKSVKMHLKQLLTDAEADEAWQRCLGPCGPCFYCRPLYYLFPPLSLSFSLSFFLSFSFFCSVFLSLSLFFFRSFVLSRSLMYTCTCTCTCIGVSRCLCTRKCTCICTCTCFLLMCMYLNMYVRR